MGRQQMGIVPPADAAPRTRTAVLKALALDENNFDAARAQALQPDAPVARTALIGAYFGKGRRDEMYGLPRR